MSVSNDYYKLLAPFCYGSAAGFVESITTYWSVTWRYYLQRNRPLPNTVKEFYKGCVLNTKCWMLFMGTMSFANEMAKKSQKMTGQSKVGEIVPPLFGGVLASVILNPVDVTTIQRIENQDPSLSVTAQKIYRTGGLSLFYRGWMWALARNVPYSLGIHYFGPKCKGFLNDKTNLKTPLLSTILGVGIPSLALGVLTQVPDYVKTQVQSFKVKRGRDVLKNLYQSRSFTPLIAGFVPRLIRIGAGSVVFVLSMEAFKRGAT